jgi:glycosyltransferase involved in cell wall biosynthesis
MSDVLLLWVLPALSLLLACIAAIMFAGNLPLFVKWRDDESNPNDHVPRDVNPSISVLIPARDEAAGIRQSVAAVLASTGVTLEVVVLDDGSTDGTGDIVRQMAEHDARVRLLKGIDLPAGWNGKQHACYRLAEVARYELLLFLDADVRLLPQAISLLIQRKMSDSVTEQSIALLSAFPRQETGTLFEKLLIPMMHYILLCYLPFSRMRGSTHPAYASGCGQLFLTDRDSYQRSGGHDAIRSTRHDGLKLPQVFRQNGMLTDCIDGTELATCRMYTSAGAVVRGLLKNAHEGIANPRLLLPFTILLGGANVLPYMTLAYGLVQISRAGNTITVWFAMLASVAAIVLSHLPRWVAVGRFRQSFVGAILHPLGISLFLLLQWWAFANHLRGKQVAWRGRNS